LSKTLTSRIERKWSRRSCPWHSMRLARIWLQT
jgi:hypothetical protein